MRAMQRSTGSATLILASRSARRAQLLRDAGYQFEQVRPPFADPPSPSDGQADSGARLAGELATQKALSALKLKELRDRPGLVVLGADTLCVTHDGRLLGQPIDREEARRMIRGLLGRSHRVLTGIALLRDGELAATITDEAEVRFGRLDDDLLNAYLAGETWRGKAGGYKPEFRIRGPPIGSRASPRVLSDGQRPSTTPIRIRPAILACEAPLTGSETHLRVILIQNSGYNLFERQADGWAVTVHGDATTVVGLPMRRLERLLADLAVLPTASQRLGGP